MKQTYTKYWKEKNTQVTRIMCDDGRVETVYNGDFIFPFDDEGYKRACEELFLFHKQWNDEINGAIA